MHKLLLEQSWGTLWSFTEARCMLHTQLSIWNHCPSRSSIYRVNYFTLAQVGLAGWNTRSRGATQCESMVYCTYITQTGQACNPKGEKKKFMTDGLIITQLYHHKTRSVLRLTAGWANFILTTSLTDLITVQTSSRTLWSSHKKKKKITDSQR